MDSHKLKRVFGAGVVALALVLGWVAQSHADSAMAVGALIQGGGTPKGFATTLNFSTGTTVSLSGGVATVTASGSGGGSYSQSFTSQTSVTLTHMLGTTTVVVSCYDTSSPPQIVVPNTIQLTDSNDVTVTFLNSQSGTCVVLS